MTQPLSVVLTTLVPEGSVDIKKGRLGWSAENNFFALTISTLRVREAADAGLLAEDIYIELSGPAFWEDGRIALSKAIVERLTLMPTRINDLPAAAGLFLPSGDGQIDGLQYISEIAVRDIRVQTDGEAKNNGSHLLMMRRGNRISASLQIEYGPANDLSSIVGTAEIGTDGGGKAEIALSRLDPRDIGRFSNFLAPLRGIQLPVTAMMNVDFAQVGCRRAEQLICLLTPVWCNSPGHVLMFANWWSALMSISKPSKLSCAIRGLMLVAWPVSWWGAPIISAMIMAGSQRSILQ